MSFLATSHGQGVNFLFRHLNTSDGLISNQVSVTFQDSKGFVWIGTQTGLQRYDGKRFTNYLADVHDPTALQSDWINTIFEDSRKRFWIGTSVAGASLMDRTTGHFFNFNRQPGSVPITGIWQFIEDGKGVIWASAYDAFYRFDEEKKKFLPVNALLRVQPGAYPATIGKDPEGNLIFCTTKGPIMYSVKDGSVYDHLVNPANNRLLAMQRLIVSVAFDSRGNAWASTGYDGFLYRFPPGNKEPVIYSFVRLQQGDQASDKLQKEFLGGAFIASDKQLLLPVLSRGLAVFDYVADSFKVINANNQRPDKLHLVPNTFTAFTLNEDREHNIWLSSDAGINVFNLHASRFRTFGLPAMDGDTPAPASEVSAGVQTADGDLFISYYFAGGGIKQFDHDLRPKHHYLWQGPMNYKGDENQVWCMFQDREGIIWAPNQAGHILLLDPKKEKLSMLRDTALYGPINEIRQDEAGLMWMAHDWKGLIRMDPIHHSITRFAQFINAQANSTRALCLLPDQSRIWVGTIRNGLQLFDKPSGKFVKSWVLDQDNDHSITDNTVIALLDYSPDTLIVGTLGGINIFNKRTGEFTALLGKDGLPNNLVQAITLDKDHNIWAAFAGGLSKISLHPLSITNFDQSDGVIDNRFNHPFTQLQDGRLMIGATRSMLLFDPVTPGSSEAPPDVTITGFHVFDEALAVDSLIGKAGGLSLGYRENSLHIEFAALQFSRPGAIRYYYQLNGVDKEWMPATEEQSTRYNQLPPGHYVFRVKCISREGIFSRHVTELQINILPPFWQTWWFITVIIIFSLLGLYGFIRWREYNIRQIEAGKTRVQQLTAENYRAQFEAEQISSFFSTSLLNKTDVDDVLWEVAKNLIAKLGLVDCIIYLWNDDHTRLIQKAGYGPKGSLEQLESRQFDVVPGQGVVGAVAAMKKAVIIPDTSKDSRYRVDDMVRASEICVPIMYNEQLIGIIDSEHHEKDFFNRHHLQALTSIATLVASKIKSIEAEQRLRHQKAELADINQQLAEVQLAALRSQMNPHFIFNALNSIKKFVIANESENAGKYLGKFSRLIRSILDNSRTGSVSVDKEIQLLRLYLELEQLRFGNRLTWSLDVSEEIDTHNVQIPSMIIQPFVENAMLHGIMHREDGGHVSVRFSAHSTWIAVVVEDNGVGRKNSIAYKSEHAEPHHSIGIEVAGKRLAALKKDNDTPAGIEIIDLEHTDGEAAGTRVVIAIPTE